MNLLSIGWKNIWEKPLSAALSILLLMLGVGIISLLLLLNKQLDDKFNRNIRGIDMVVGAKGSPLQLILASVYHIDYPTGNIPKTEADRLLNHPLVQKGMPLAYGDNYKSYRILGTDTAYINHYKLKLKEGNHWEKPLDVCIGNLAAKNLGLSIGDEFFSSHGLASEDDVHDHRPYKVTGIYEPSNSVADQLIMTSIESVWAIHEKEEEEGSSEEEDNEYEAEEEEKEYTSLLLKFRNPMGIVTLPRYINQNTSMQAAVPAIEINQLRSRLGIGIVTMQGVALAIIIISGVSVFISLFNSLKERKYELALMRTMGASREKIFALILLEGLVLAIIGFVLGMILSRMGMWLLTQYVADDYHYTLDGMKLMKEESILFLATIGIGILAATLPAIKGFNLNISNTLAEG